jgi:hypothetical protein
MQRVDLGESNQKVQRQGVKAAINFKFYDKNKEALGFLIEWA